MSTMSVTLSQARVVDPVLSNVARGFTQQLLAGTALFPMVPVMLAGGNIIVFGDEEFRQYNLRRAPGTATKRIPIGHAGAPYALFQDSVEVPVPREHMRDASRQPGLNLGTTATNKAMRTMMLALEVEQAALARTAANYAASNRVALAPGARWSNPGVDPAGTIETGREAIRAAVGVYPNTAVVSARAMAALRRNGPVLERIKYTGRDNVTEDLLASLWDVERVVVGRSLTRDAAGASTDCWGTDVVLAYTAIGALDNAEPSYGFTYQMEGHPLVEPAYWENSTKSWIYGATFERVPVIAGAGAGFLIQTAAD